VSRENNDESRFRGVPTWLAVFLAGGVCAILAVVALVVADIRTTWSQVDAAADSFDPPAGFRQVSDVRSGSAWCVVSCSRGEPEMTRVFTWTGGAPEGCSILQRAFDEAVRSTEQADTTFECKTWGQATSEVRGRAALAAPSQIRTFGPGEVYGLRWVDEVGIPDSPYVAWVSFTADLE